MASRAALLSTVRLRNAEDVTQRWYSSFQVELRALRQIGILPKQYHENS